MNDPITIAPGVRPATRLAEYRDLLWLLVRVDYVAKIKQTRLGPLWFLLQPVAMAGAFVGVFTKIIHWDSAGIPPLLFYFSGLVVWGYFSQSLHGVAACLGTYAPLFRKVYFPRLVIPVSVVVAKAIPLALQLGLFLVALAVWSPAHAGMALLRLPPTLLAAGALTVATALGAGLLLAALSIRFRDLQHALSFLLQLGLYASPVVYAPANVPEPYRSSLFLNPIAGAIEVFRAGMFGIAWSAPHVGISALTAAALLLLGLDRFERVEGRFVDTI